VADDEDPRTRIADLYPDVTGAGGLTGLLRAKMLERVDVSACAFLKGAESVRSPYWASCETSRRHGDITCAMEERLFLASFWELGVELVRLQTMSPDILTGALLAWYVDATSTSVLRHLITEVRVLDHAAAYEAGASAYVDYRWSELASYDNGPCFAEMVDAAGRRPELRQLLPFTSHDRLCFSRGTGYPFTKDCPSIRPLKAGMYQVQVNQRSLGTADLDKALGIVVGNLPPGVGPAMHGHPSYWARTGTTA
jgi:hypothetical protein